MLTPYLGGLAADLDRAMAAVLDLPQYRVRVDVERAPARVVLPGLTLVVRRGEGAWTAPPLAFTVERPASAERARPLLAHLQRRLQGEVDGSEAATALGLREDFRDERDVMWRRVEHTAYGPVGMLRLGFRCNQSCYFCPQSRSWSDPPWALVETWLEELAAQGLELLTLTGGEPTIYPGFLRLLERAAELGLGVLVQTNAVRFASPRFTRAALEAGVGIAFVSFHAHERQVSDGITGAPGTLVKTVAGIEALLSAGLPVCLNTCVVEENVDLLPAMARFLVERFVDPFPSNPLLSVDLSQPGAYFHDHLTDASMVPYDRVREPLVEAARVLSEAGVHVNATGTCGFAPCLFRDAPALIPWRRVDRLDHNDLGARAHAQVCERCAARTHCVGVRRQVLDRFGDRGLVPYATLPFEDTGEPFDPLSILRR